MSLAPSPIQPRPGGAVKANGGKGARKGIFCLGVSATRWKGSIRPRKSKEIQAFFFDFLCPGLAGLCWISINLGLVWDSRRGRVTYISIGVYKWPAAAQLEQRFELQKKAPKQLKSLRRSQNRTPR